MSEPRTCIGCGKSRFIKARDLCAACYSKTLRGASPDAPDGRTSPGLAEILAAPGAPTLRQVNHWVELGLLRPQVEERDGRDRWA